MKNLYLKYFYEISKIPRKSGHEKMIAEYIVDFAKSRNLEYYIDDFWNVIVKKKATNSNNEIIGLQAHIDMVCEKAEGKEFDFFTQSLELIEEDGFIKANGTTLGADNGVGVAYILAILDSNNISHPNIEAIFTTQEETTMDGARNLDESKLSCKKIISFDNFSEDEMWIGSAEAHEWYMELDLERVNDEFSDTYKLELTNFLGGHSGMNIGDSKRGNPIKIVSDILKDEEIYLVDIKGGSAINVIPRDCSIIFKIKNKDIINNVKRKINNYINKYTQGDFILEKYVDNNIAFSKTSTESVLRFINDMDNGALEFDENNNVIVSGNFANISIHDNKVNFGYSIRTNRKKLSELYINKAEEFIKSYNIKLNNYDNLNGYEQSKDSELIKICTEKYKEVMNKEPNALGVQACLECSYLGKKIKDLQYVALGCNIYDAHSPKEKVEVKSMERTWKILLKVLDA